MLSFHAASIIASWVRTEYPAEPGGHKIPRTSERMIGADAENNVDRLCTSIEDCFTTYRLILASADLLAHPSFSSFFAKSPNDLGGEFADPVDACADEDLGDDSLVSS